MCQYSATHGVANDWHFVHLGARAVGGAGIVCVEATHVEARGRISKHCLGLWNDVQRDQLARIARFLAEQGAVPAIQLSHAGRKASVSRPWEGSVPLCAESGGWAVIGPSALRFCEGYPWPLAMDPEMISEVILSFGLAAERARRAGFKIVELHAAHGYLIHQFLSPLTNIREDCYGGSLENRARFLMDVLDSIRSEWPPELPLFVRLSVTDWMSGGLGLNDTIALCRMLAARGDVDVIDCSSGGADPRQEIPIYPGYQIGFAERIREATGLRTAAVGLIHSPEMAEEIVANNRADIVILGRSLLFDPHWPFRAANVLKAKNFGLPVQYERSNIF